jgi:hypothetical protein
VEASNPRVAAILNLVTKGFGYFYLGWRATAVVVFFLLNIAQRYALAHGGLRGTVYSTLSEVTLAFLSFHGYWLAKRRLKPRVEAVPWSNPFPKAHLELSAILPIAVGALLAANYVAWVGIAIAMPSYKHIDISRESILQTKNGPTFSNPAYRVSFSAPPGWKIDGPAAKSKNTLAEARFSTDSGKCIAEFVIVPHNPLLSVHYQGELLRRKLLADSPKYSFQFERDATLSGFPAEQLDFLVKGKSAFVEQHYFLAARGLTIYSFVETERADDVSICDPGLDSIRHSIQIR